VTAISTTRAVERCQLLATLGPPPAWWRVFALRRWLRAYRAIMAFDISVHAEMMRSFYPAEVVKGMADRSNNTFISIVTMPARGQGPIGRWVDPVEYMTPEEQALAAQQLNQRRPR
jgi:hypothetical protein